MAFNASQFRSQLEFDGARPNLFDVNILFPTFVNNTKNPSDKIQFMAKSAQLPGSTIGIVPIYYFGRELKFAGNRTFPDWTVTIINDEDFVVRNALEQWLSAINSHAGNVRSQNASNPLAYSPADATVNQYSKIGGDPIKKYTFTGLFPVDLSTIDLDWSSNDSIEEYTVTFAYQYWTSDTTDV